MKLSKRLDNLRTYPFHMPGHKRNQQFCITGSEIDITEIDGFDNLHNPTGVLNQLEKDISEIFGYKKSMISVNGSTCGILAAICALCEKGDKIIIARNCHKAVYNACFLQELDVVYLEPEFDTELGIYTRITQEAVDKITKENPDAKALVITSPTYEGFISELDCKIPLIMDAAHGAHFGFSDCLPARAKGDIVIQSLHKTLPCLTQTAVVHINNSKYFDRVKMYMDIFESSSPSYILLNSVDKCVDFLKDCAVEFTQYKNKLDMFRSKAQKLENITIHKNDDRTRLILSADGYTGAELSEHLRKNGIEPEGASLNYVILISTVADTDRGFDLLLKALDSTEKRKPLKNNISKPEMPQRACKSSDIKHTQITAVKDSIGQICGTYIYAYPPGIPIIVPGEIISQEIVEKISLYIKKGVNIISDDNLLPDNILTKAAESCTIDT